MKISSVVLAAGMSRRMGRPKLLLPWGNSSVICTVASNLISTNMQEIIIVAGELTTEFIDATNHLPVVVVQNPHYYKDDMVLSLKTGLRALQKIFDAVLICLGDNPHMETRVIQQMQNYFHENRPPLLIPSFEMKRGHPWLVRKDLCAELLMLKENLTMRDFINYHKDLIHYLDVETPTVFMDLDTPEDYEAQRPSRKSGNNSSTAT